MTKNEIKNKMISLVQEHLNSELEDLEISDLISDDEIYDFMWERDFGAVHIRNYIDNHTDELVESYLEEIYDEIDKTDLETPW